MSGKEDEALKIDEVRQRLLQTRSLPSTVLWGSNLTRPTTAFARGCKLWSRERQFYEEERRRNMVEFSSKPYMHNRYPMLEKHYPGTWTVVGPGKLKEIVARLSRPTQASIHRERDIQSASPWLHSRRKQSNFSIWETKREAPKKHSMTSNSLPSV